MACATKFIYLHIAKKKEFPIHTHPTKIPYLDVVILAKFNQNQTTQHNNDATTTTFAIRRNANAIFVARTSRTTLNLIIYSRKFVMTGTVWYERNSSVGCPFCCCAQVGESTEHQNRGKYSLALHYLTPRPPIRINGR